jgi:hypothetical protein
VIADAYESKYLLTMGRNVEIDEDILRAAERIAAESNSTPGRVISELVRRAMRHERPVDELPVRDGFRYMPKRGGKVTPELVERLAEDDV